MTRLNAEIRDEIVRKIMAKVPNLDYQQMIAKCLNDAAREIAPAEILQMQGTALWPYVSSAKVFISGDGYFMVCPLPRQHHDTLEPTHPDQTWRKLWDAFEASGLRGASERQNKARRSMKQKLDALMKTTTTVEGLRKVLSPDLHQFVPVIIAGDTANLPVPALVSELKAMGMEFPVVSA